MPNSLSNLPRVASNPPPSASTFRLPEIRPIAWNTSLEWLRSAWADMRSMPVASLFYGIVLTAIGVASWTLVESTSYKIALASGVILIGPFLAGGLCDLSRSGTESRKSSLLHSLTAWKHNALAISLFGIVLVILLGLWSRTFVVLIAIYFAGEIPEMPVAVEMILGSTRGWVFIFLYSLAGSFFAAFVFAISTVTIPLLLDRADFDVPLAVVVSFKAAWRNRNGMVLWALLIVALMAIGFATRYIGFVFILPLLGHATWHSYAEMIERPDRKNPGN